MRFKIKLHLDKLLNHTFDTSGLFQVIFLNTSNFDNWNDSIINNTLVKQIIFDFVPMIPDKDLRIFENPEGVPTTILHNNDILTASITSTYIIFECDKIAEDSDFDYLFKNGIIEIIDVVDEGYTLLLLYRMNDKRNHINKNLIIVDYMVGKFKAPLGIKRIDIDIENYEIENIYNYVYIPKLNRYYYVTDIQFMNNKFTRLNLQEDVLMSWADLIKQQKAFIERCANSGQYDLYIDDPEVKTNFQKEVYVENVLLTGTALTNFYSETSTPFLLTVVRK